MTGTVLAVFVVFAILLVMSRSISYYRGRFSVAGSEASGSDVRRSAALGAGSGIVVVALVALLYIGITQWGWLGPPTPRAPAVLNPSEASPLTAPGPGASPSAAPSASPSASPIH